MRATQSTAITFGLVTVPVKVYVSAKSESISFRQLSPKNNPTKQLLVDSVTGENVDRKECKKGFEVSKGKFIVFEPEELSLLEDSKDPTIDIVEFIPKSKLTPLRIEKSHFLGPNKIERSYALLTDIMEKKGVIAIATWFVRNREHLVAIAPHRENNVRGLVMHQLYYDNEMRSMAEVGVTSEKASEAELDLAAQLVDKLARSECDFSQFKDKFSDRVLRVVDQKLAGEEVSIPEAPPKSCILDLYEALKASISKETG